MIFGGLLFILVPNHVHVARRVDWALARLRRAAQPYSATPHLPWGRPNGSPPRAIHQPRKIPIRTIVHGQAVL